MARKLQFSGRKASVGVRGYFFGPRFLAYVVISNTRSNQVCSLIDLSGRVVRVFYSGCVGMKGPRQKRSFLAAEKIGVSLGEYAAGLNIKSVLLILKIPVSGQVFGVVRGLDFCGLHVWGVKDSYCSPHNGMREKKARRV